jgi:pimeloyl-ACP methyl ester carboxylesterase
MTYFKDEHRFFLHVNENTRIFVITNFKPGKRLTKKTPVIFFNYGLVCNFNHYKYQIPFFDKLGYHIILHDYRHHFQSASNEPIETLTFKNIVSDMRAIYDELKVKQSIMLGHSMGVNVSLEFARTYPKLTNKMILISGTVLPPQDIMFDTNLVEVLLPFIKSLSKDYPSAFKFIWKNSYFNPLVQHVIHKGGFNTEKVDMKFVEFYLKRISELTPELFLQLFEEMKHHDVLKDLEKIEVETLIIGGAEDQVIPNYYQNILKEKLPNSCFHEIEAGSHVPQVDFPETINHMIQDFLIQE